MTGSGTAKKPLLGAGVRIFVYIVAIALLGVYTGMQVILAFRSIFTGSLLLFAVRLGWLGLGVGLTWLCFRRLRPLRESAGPAASDLLFYLAVALFLTGFLGYRAYYRSPATELTEAAEEDRRDCSSHVSSVLFASGPVDTHEPGSGYIVLRATFTAKSRLVLRGGGWLPHAPGSDAVFSAELPRTELEPGKPKELTFYLLVNPEFEYSRELVSDGPYFIPEITAYVHDPARRDHWATWAGEISCRAAVIKNYATGPYKAGQMGRLKWRYEGDYPFLRHEPKMAGKKAAGMPAAVKTPQSPGEKDPLLEEAQRALKEAEELLERSKQDSGKYSYPGK